MSAPPRPPRSTPPRGGAALTIAELGDVLDASVTGTSAATSVVTGVEQDSRRIGPGDLFVALRGGRVDGLRFAPAAIERGAVAVLTERVESLPELGVPLLVVDAARPALARAAAAVHRHPTRETTVIGITGTNGKTTCSHLVEQCVKGVGHVPGIVGTLGYRGGGTLGPLIHTSPEADELQRVARTLVDHGVTHLVMEVSSIALAADRVREVAFDVVAFTNLTQDHLDWHGSMDAYAAAKEQLFFDYGAATAVVVVDQPFGVRLADRLAQAGDVRVIRVSSDPARPADVYAPSRRLTLSGLELTVSVAEQTHHVAAPLPGEHNVQNVLCAAAIAHALELDLTAALGALAEVPQVPGRLELVSVTDDDIAGLVDYAHTPDALERVLSAVRPHVEGRLWCVFGCGGDRDPTKRGPMGHAVARGADVAVVTNDNPRSEDPAAIAEAIVAGLVDAGSATHRVELDRAAAIELAVSNADAGDAVVVAGKGHETYQIIGETVASFDDRVALREALAARRERREQAR